MMDIKWRDAVKNADAYKKIGETTIYLFRGDDDLPWEFANHCEPGGTHRMDIATDVRFTADHPCGLTFQWTFDIEGRSADGKSYYQIKIVEIGQLLAMLPQDCAKSFRDYLKQCSVKVRERGNEYQDIASKQFGEAAVLERLSGESQ
jgi:hypothetical protein